MRYATFCFVGGGGEGRGGGEILPCSSFVINVLAQLEVKILPLNLSLL